MTTKKRPAIERRSKIMKDVTNHKDRKYPKGKGLHKDNTDEKIKMAEVTRYLEEYNERMRELDMQKDAFLDIAAHELKTPITSIKGFSQLLQEEDIIRDIEKSRHYLQTIDDNSSRLHTLIMNMVDAFKIMNSELKHNVEQIDPYQLMSGIKDNLEPQILRRGLEAEFNIEEGLPTFYSDQEKISRTIRNLASNSLENTESGKISIRITKDREKKGFITFEIKDTGRGIPEHHQKILFKPFNHTDMSLNRKSGGIGLGLFISKGLIDSIGGEMTFESRIGEGTTFRLMIPENYNEDACMKAASTD